MFYYLKFCYSVRTCETACFTYCIRWRIVSRDSIVHRDWLCDRLMSPIRYDTDVAKNWGSCHFLCEAHNPGERLYFELIAIVKMKLCVIYLRKKTLASFQTLRTREDRFLPNRVFTWSALRAYNNARAINRIFRPTLCWCACLSVRMCVKRAGCTVARVFCRLRC